MATESAAVASAQDSSPTIQHAGEGICGNLKLNSDREVCPNKAEKICDRCHLIKYCSRECQIDHWATHKADCKNPYGENRWSPRWVLQRRLPAWATQHEDSVTFGMLKYLWGNMPALDIMNIDQNEGRNYDKEIGLCFAASGDIRNVIQSILGLPEGSKSQSTIVVNDRDLDIVVRNFAMLSIVHQRPPDEAAEVILHIWYSARLSTKASQAIRMYVLPLVEDVVEKIKNKSFEIIQSKTWIFGTRSLRLCLYKAQWKAVLAKLIPLSSTSQVTESSRQAVMLAPSRQDYLDRALVLQPPRHRQCTMRFRETGVLLPFSHDIRAYTIPNQTLFDRQGNWQQKDSADPLQGWPVQEVLKSGVQFGVPKNDICGALHHHVLSTLKKFCNRLSTMNIDFHMLASDATDLPSFLSTLPLQYRFFDRIEVSNIVDACYLGLAKTLTTLGPWLKPFNENSHAALLALFLNAVPYSTERSDTTEVVENPTCPAYRFLPKPDTRDSFRSCPANIKFASAVEQYRDFDGIFRRYMNAEELRDYGRAAGLKMREEHTVVAPWPLRLDKHARDEKAKRKFEEVLAGGFGGSERYVEWVKAAPGSTA